MTKSHDGVGEFLGVILSVNSTLSDLSCRYASFYIGIASVVGLAPFCA